MNCEQSVLIRFQLGQKLINKYIFLIKTGTLLHIGTCLSDLLIIVLSVCVVIPICSLLFFNYGSNHEHLHC